MMTVQGSFTRRMDNRGSRLRVAVSIVGGTFDRAHGVFGSSWRVARLARFHRAGAASLVFTTSPSLQRLQETTQINVCDIIDQKLICFTLKFQKFNLYKVVIKRKFNCTVISNVKAKLKIFIETQCYYLYIKYLVLFYLFPIYIFKNKIHNKKIILLVKPINIKWATYIFIHFETKNIFIFPNFWDFKGKEFSFY